LYARSPQINRQSFVGFGVLVAGLTFAYVVGQLIVGETIQKMAVVLIGAGVLVVAMRILNNWRTGFYVFLVWLLFEDMVRKHMGNNMAIYFAKDVMVVLIYIALFVSLRRRREPTFRPPFLMAIAVFFWFGVLQMFNLHSPSFLYGGLGVKLYFLYIPLMFVGYELVRSDADLQRFLTASLLLAAAIAGLGVIQSIVGPQFLNPTYLAPEIRELGDLQKVTPITHQIIHLPASVFVSTGRYGEYLFLAAVLGMGTAGYLLLYSARGRGIVFGSLGIVAVAIALCGSRGTLLLALMSAIVMSSAFIWGAPWRTRQVYRMFAAIRRAAIIMVMCLVVAIMAFPTEIGSRWAFYSETLSPSSTANELPHRVWEYPLRNLMGAFSEPNWVEGNGIGTASLGIQYVAAYLHQRPLPIAVESGWGDIVVEFGFFGLILWLIWTTLVIVGCWRVTLQLKQTRMFPIGFAIAWFVFVMLGPDMFATINSFQDYVLNAYLWILIGVLYHLPEILFGRPVAVPSAATAPSPTPGGAGLLPAELPTS
jgi:hypothetical protein